MAEKSKSDSSEIDKFWKDNDLDSIHLPPIGDTLTNDLSTLLHNQIPCVIVVLLSIFAKNFYIPPCSIFTVEYGVSSRSFYYYKPFFEKIGLVKLSYKGRAALWIPNSVEYYLELFDKYPRIIEKFRQWESKHRGKI